MAQIRLVNFGDTTLAAGIAPGDTTLSFNALDATTVIPTLTAGDWCYGVLVDVAGNKEIVKATAHTAGTRTVTILRAQEGTGVVPDTTGLTFSVGSVFSVRLTIQAFADYMATLSSVYGVPTQTGNAGKLLTTNGTATSWVGYPISQLTMNQSFGGL